MMRLLPAFDAMQNSAWARKPSVCWRTKCGPAVHAGVFTGAGPAEGWHHRPAGANRVPRRMPRPVRA